METETPIKFVRLSLPEDREALMNLLTREIWPYHMNAYITKDRASELINSGKFSKDKQETFWILENEQRVGFVQAETSDGFYDMSPLLDLRILASHRGKGIGTVALKWITERIFTRFSHFKRIAAKTRADNKMMRAVLEHCGYVKEGHFRQSWPDETGHRHDAVFYALLQSDWRDGKVTPVDWDYTG